MADLSKIVTGNKKAPAGVPDQARANTLKTHYYNTISEVVFTSGVLCPACKRGHLSKVIAPSAIDRWLYRTIYTCDRCNYKEFKSVIQSVGNLPKYRDLDLSDRQDIFALVKDRAISQGITQYRLAAESGVHCSTLSLCFSGKSIPKEETLYKLCKALNIEMGLMSYDC